MTPAFQPIRMLDVDMAEPLEAIEPARAADRSVYELAQVLVRCHSQPVGLVDVALQAGRLDARALAAIIDAALGEELRRHRIADGLGSEPVAGPGLPPCSEPTCLQSRREALERAPVITVAIPTRGRPELIVPCVAAVVASEYPAQRLRVIVVDNVPEDAATRDAVARAYAGDPRVAYLRCDISGSAAARNAALAVADTELIAFVDDDVTVDRHWLAELVAGFGTDERVACVTGGILPLELETASQLLMERFGGFHKGFAGRRWSLDAPPDGDPLFPYTAGRFGSGNNVAFRVPALRALGGYDELLGNGTPAQAGEDFELLLRTVRSGWTLVYRPTALVRHLHRRSHAALRTVIESYGVAITAVLLRTVWHDPRALGEILVRIPRGLVYLLSSSSAKNRQHAGAYPLRLRLLEIGGMLRGPLAYLASRRQARLGRA